MFDNIVDMARPAAQEAETRAITQHKIATSHRLTEELCLDLARKHARCVEWTECDTCRRLTHKHRRSRSRDYKAVKKAVWRCIACDRKFAARDHYEQIARLLYCRRPKPFSEVAYAQKRNASLNCMTHAETLLWRDLASVVNDPSYEMQRRQNAAQELKELREKIDRRSEHLERELLAAACSTESFESRVEKMLNKVREFESIDSKKFFEKGILRYLTAKTRNATWVASLPLLEYLALEWLRDKRSLGRFLDASFARWKDFKNPKSVRHRSIVIHQLHGSQASLDECGEQNIKPMGEIVARLLKQSGGSPGDGADKLNGVLRAQKSRELSKSRAKQPAIRVTIR